MVRDVEPRNAERECYKRWHHCELKTDFDRDLGTFLVRLLRHRGAGSLSKNANNLRSRKRMARLR